MSKRKSPIKHKVKATIRRVNGRNYKIKGFWRGG